MESNPAPLTQVSERWFLDRQLVVACNKMSDNRIRVYLYGTDSMDFHGKEAEEIFLALTGKILDTKRTA